MGFIVNKPTFDTEQLKPGTALRVKSIKCRNAPWYSFNRNVLVTECTPLELHFAFIANDNNRYDTLTLPIELVADESIRITPLIEELMLKKGDTTL